MLSKLKTFIKKDQDGAVSVDWVALTAALVGLAVATIIAIQSATVDFADRTSLSLTERIVGVAGQVNNTGSGS